MERDQIDVKYTWNLSTIYQNEEGFYQDLEKAKLILKDLSTYQDKLCVNIDNFYSYLTSADEAQKLLNRLYSFAHLNCDVEPTNQAYQTMLAAIMNVLETASISLSFVDNEICDNQEAVLSYLKDPKLTVYEYHIKSVLSYKPHILDKSGEALIAKVDAISDTSSKVFDALRLEYDDVDIDGKKEFLNSATLNKFLKNPDRKVRQQAYQNFFKEYKRYENVYANILGGVMKKDAFYAEVRNFDSSLASSVFDDDVPTELFFKVLDMANNKYRHLFHRYNKLKKKLLNVESLYNYDLNVPLVSAVEKKYTIDECFDLINTALKPFGQDYLDIISEAKENRWIDYYPHKGKRSGAYSGGSYDTNPFILMNFIGDYNSLSTLTHELGHSVHSYLSHKHQDFVNSHYRIFVAEVASTVNETLLINHVINSAQSNEEKAYFIYEQLENCVGLIFRQPMFADFEYKLHTMAENNEPLSSSAITDLYHQLSKEYYGQDVILDELVGHSCYYVPHFYYNFYVYKYTLGMTIALAIVQRILNNDQEQVDKYLNFLKSGGSKSPLDLLKDAGVNPLDDAIYDDAFNYFEELLDQFENIIK